jgi:uncharacterized Zn finger protein
MTDVSFAFLVQGSSPQPYRVLFARHGAALTITCTCAAGLVGQVCKHRLGLLAGDTKTLVSGNGAEISQALDLIIGTPLQTALDDVAAAERALDERKAEVANRKHALSRIMQGG